MQWVAVDAARFSIRPEGYPANVANADEFRRPCAPFRESAYRASSTAMRPTTLPAARS